MAEGIECPQQLERLRSLGCEYGQSYLFSPRSAETIRARCSTPGAGQYRRARPEPSRPVARPELDSGSPIPWWRRKRKP
jgi:EAL domain-containing protein (putative c-di-GMP-specific phosphodiesterase class I)